MPSADKSADRVEASFGLRIKWNWYYYQIRLAVKYRKSMMNSELEGIIIEIATGLKERYTIGIQTIGFDRDHVHFMRRFCRLIKEVK